jgi:hypothetical protein
MMAALAYMEDEVEELHTWEQPYEWECDLERVLESRERVVLTQADVDRCVRMLEILIGVHNMVGVVSFTCRTEAERTPENQNRLMASIAEVANYVRSEFAGPHGMEQEIAAFAASCGVVLRLVGSEGTVQ